MRYKGEILVRGRIAAAVAGLVLSGLMLLGCSSTSSVSSGSTFHADSKKAIIILGTSIAGYEGTTNDKKPLEPLLFATLWQQYDPVTLALVRSDSLQFSVRGDSVWESDDGLKHWEIAVTEIPPGSYALAATFVHRTVTTFFPLTDKTRTFRRSINGLSVNLEGSVDPAKNIFFEAKPGQVLYLGHFEFLSAPHNSDFIAGINYSHDEAAARAALAKSPGVTVPMTTLDLKTPTRQAALQ